MKLLETLVLSQYPDHFSALVANLTLETAAVMGVDTYRFAIDTDLAAMLYHAPLDKPFSEATLVHLYPHLSAMLILVDRHLNDLSEIQREVIDQIAANLNGGSLVIAVHSDGGRIDALPETVRDTGMFLAPRGRLTFWHPDLLSTRKGIFNLLWHDLLQPATP